MLAINYFGFPQDLTPFHDFCSRTRAVLIEDNAHGLFGRDSAGLLLGTRGDLGILSMRKSLPLPDGAALLINNPGFLAAAPKQLPASDMGTSYRFIAKEVFRRIVRITGSGPVFAALRLFRTFRKAWTGLEIPSSAFESEWEMPAAESPDRSLIKNLSRVDPECEIGRRRKLYALLDEQLHALGATPIMQALKPGTSPYCYAFLASDANARLITARLRELRLNCHLWPELPAELEETAPTWQKRVWVVGFLW